MLRVLLLNGPPGSGKDEVTRLPDCPVPLHFEKFAKPLYESASALLGLSVPQLEQIKRYDPFVRKLLIALSEDLVKPIYGRDHFGLACAKRVFSFYTNTIGDCQVVITDCGFQEEADAFIQYLKDSFDYFECELWQIHRPGCDFKSDSRGWVTVANTRKIFNSGSLENYHEELRLGLTRFFTDRQ